MHCPACHAENDDASAACAGCGQTLTVSPFPTLSAGTVVGGRYEILSLLGKGGMGMVFKAKDRVLDEVVALKILRPDIAGSGEMARRFRNEIKLARKVRHKNVCGIHEYNEEGSLQYIAMEYIEGIDLKRLLRTRGGLPPAEAFDISLQLANGLAAIHDVGIIHRDLKTANAMLDEQGAVRLMDFGIAKKFDAEGSLGTTAVGHVIGTPEYMSPEQARGEKIDFRSDIYALGVMIFELFTGHVPFQAETPIATIFKHLQEPPPLDGPAAAAIPTAAVAVLAQCLAKDPDARFPSAVAVAEALAAAQAATLPKARPQPETATRGFARGALPFAERSASAPRTPPSHPVIPAPTRLVASTPTLAGGTRGDAPAEHGAWTRPLLLMLGVATAIGAVAAVVVIVLWLGNRQPQPPPDRDARRLDASPEATVAEPGPSSSSTPAPDISPPPRVATLGVTTPTPTTYAISTPPRAVLRLDTRTPATPSGVPTPSPTPGGISTATIATNGADAVLDITAKPAAEVLVDGERLGQTPLKGLRLAPGTHAIVLVHPDYQPFRRKMTLESGKRRSLDIDLSWDGVRK